MRLPVFLVCDRADSDAEGRLNVHGVIHALYAPGFPAKQSHLVLVLVIEWEPGEDGSYGFRIDLRGPDDSTSLTVEGHTEVEMSQPGKPPPTTRLILPMEEVIFPRPGPYRFDLRLKGHTTAGPVLHLIEDRASLT